MAFIHLNDNSIKDIHEFKKLCKNDKNLDLTPENYIDSKISTTHGIQKEVGGLIRENIALNIRFVHKFND